MKRVIKASRNIRWEDLSGSEQSAVEIAHRLLMEGYSIEDAAYKACDQISYGNAEPEYEDEDFYLDEPNERKVVDYLSGEEDTRKVTASNSIQSFKCPNCHNKTVFDVDRDVYSLTDVRYGDTFICDECGSEFEGSLGYSGIDLTPITEEEW